MRLSRGVRLRKKGLGLAGYTYSYPRPMVTVDAVVFALRSGQLSVLLVRRKNDPFAGQWALPGGFVDVDEPLDAAVQRELHEETGLSGIQLFQFHAFGDPGRDPRGRSISVAYLGIADAAQHAPRGHDDAAEAAWFPASRLPKLAFDHDEIVKHAVKRLQFLVTCAAAGITLPDTLEWHPVFRHKIAETGRED